MLHCVVYRLKLEEAVLQDTTPTSYTLQLFYSCKFHSETVVFSPKKYVEHKRTWSHMSKYICTYDGNASFAIFGYRYDSSFSESHLSFSTKYICGHICDTMDDMLLRPNRKLVYGPTLVPVIWGYVILDKNFDNVMYTPCGI